MLSSNNDYCNYLQVFSRKISYSDLVVPRIELFTWIGHEPRNVKQFIAEI